MGTQSSLVVLDLAPHPEKAWAVIWRGQLLPIRFAREGEASDHLLAMDHPERAIFNQHRDGEANGVLAQAVG